MWSAREIMWPGGRIMWSARDHVTRGGSCDQLETMWPGGGSAREIMWPGGRIMWSKEFYNLLTLQRLLMPERKLRIHCSARRRWREYCEGQEWKHSGMEHLHQKGKGTGCVCVCVGGGGGGTLTWLSSFWYCGTLRIYRPRSLIDTCVCAYTWHHTLAQVLRRENLGTRLITLVVLAYICVSILLRFRL